MFKILFLDYNSYFSEEIASSYVEYKLRWWLLQVTKCFYPSLVNLSNTLSVMSKVRGGIVFYIPHWVQIFYRLCCSLKIDSCSLCLVSIISYSLICFFFEHIILITSFLLCSFYYEGIKTTFRISSGQIDIFVYTFVLHFVQKLLGTLLISVLGVSPRVFWSW